MASLHDPNRLRALRRHVALDAAAGTVFRRIVRLARHGSNASSALLTFVGADEVTIQAAAGLSADLGAAYKTDPWCRHVVEAGCPVVVSDLTTDDRFASHQLVTDAPHLRFFAGVPILSPSGHVLGALSLLDTEPHSFSSAESDALRDLAEMATHELKHHVLPHAHEEILESITDAFFALDTNWCFTYVNTQAEELLSRSRDDLLGVNVWEAFPEAVDLVFYDKYHRAVETQKSVSFEAYFPPLKTWFSVNAYPFSGGLSVYFEDITDQRALEKDLRTQEAQARLLFEHNPVPMMVYARDTLRFIAVNKAAIQKYGYDRRTFLDMEITDIRPPEEIEALRSYLDTERSDFRSPPGLWTHLCADGTSIKVEVTSSAIEYEDRDAVLVAVNDVTEKYEAQQALEEREKLLSSINENITEGLYRVSADGELVYVNESFARIFGYEDPAAVMALDDLSGLYAHPEQRNEFITQAHEKGYLRGQEVKFRRADGSTFWGLISATVVTDEDGTVLYHDGALLDISARKEAEQALRRREEYLTVTLNSIGDAVITTDPKGHVSEMNAVAEDLTGWSAEEAQGHALPVVFPIHNSNTGAPVENPVDKVLRKGKIVGLANHTVLTARDGATYQIADSAAPIRSEDDGPLLGVVLVFRDVTESYERRAQMEAERIRLKLALRGGDLGLWDWNMNTDEVHYNDRWSEMLGYDPDEIDNTANAFQQLVHPEDGDRVSVALERHIKGEIPFIDLEIRMRASDGSWRWILDRGQVVTRNKDGSPKRVAGTHLDITERKEREDELRRTNVILEQAQSVAQMGSGIWDLENNEMWLSQEAARLLGLEPNTSYPIEAFIALVHPDDRAFIQEGLVTFKEGDGEPIEYRVIPKGSDMIRWVLGRVRVEAHDEDGDPKRMLGIIADITEQKETTEQLAHQKQLLDTTVDSLPGIFYLATKGGKFLRWNDNFEAVTDYSAGELADLHPKELFEGDDRTHIQERVARVFEEGRATATATLISKSGSRTPYLFTGSRVTLEGQTCMVGVGLDITDQKEAEAALHAREKRVESFYDAMSDLARAQTREALAERVCTLITDTLSYPICAIRYYENGRLAPVAVSDRCEALMEGKRPIYQLDGPGAVVRAFRNQTTTRYSGTDPNGEILQPGAVRSSIYVPIDTYGTISVASTSEEAVASFDAKLLEILSHAMASILDRIAREEDLRRARDEAEEMNRLKSAFLANMSHEIRTPLTSIIGFSEILEEEAKGSAQRFAQLIQTSSQRLMDTLKSVLDLSKLEAGSMDLDPQLIHVDREIQSTIDLLEPRADAKGVTIAAQGIDDSVSATLDKNALHRVLSNIVSNAIKFTPSGGRIDVHLHEVSDMLELSIADTGVGIDEAFLPNLFEAFTQESTGNTRAFEGSGLGLAITKRLVDLMGGTIEVESSKGEGTTFTVCLPRDVRSCA